MFQGYFKHALRSFGGVSSVFQQFFYENFEWLKKSCNSRTFKILLQVFQGFFKNISLSLCFSFYIESLFSKCFFSIYKGLRWESSTTSSWKSVTLPGELYEIIIQFWKNAIFPISQQVVCSEFFPVWHLVPGLQVSSVSENMGQTWNIWSLDTNWEWYILYTGNIGSFIH